MAIALLPRVRTSAPSSIAPVNRDTSIGRSVVGLVQCGAQVTENAFGRIPYILGGSGVVSPFIATPQGPSRGWAANYGPSSLHRLEWTEWNFATGPFTWFVYWRMNTQSTLSTTYTIGGNAASGSGYAIQGYGGTVRLYVAGAATAIEPSNATWPVGTPMVTVMTVDAGGVLTGYLNGKADASASGVGTISYGSFASVFFGCPGTDGPLANTNAAGNVWYFGVANRAWTPEEVALHAQNPWMLFAADPRTWFDFAGGGVAPASVALLGQACL